MFCPNCGSDLKGGARFCHVCGARVEDLVALDGSDSTPLGEGAQAKTAATFAEQMDSDRKRSRRLLSPLMIIALVLALAAGTALAAVLVVSQANRGEATPQQERPVGAETPSEADDEPTEEELVIQDLDGWWATSGYMSSGVQEKTYFFDGGDIREFDAGDDLVPYGPDAQTRYTVSSVTRLSNPFTGQLGGAHFENEPGYAVATTMPAGEFILLDSDADALLVGGAVGSLRRIVDVETLSRIEQQTGLGTPSGNPETDNSKIEDFDQAAAEEAARDAAVAAGKQVFDGTVRIENSSTRMQETGAVTALDASIENPVFAYLELDAPASVTARNADGATAAAEPYRTNQAVESVLLGMDGYGDATASPWKAYEGQRVTLACDESELRFFSDSMGALFGVRAYSWQKIAPLTESDSKTSIANYILPDSSTRAYSRSELVGMDLHSLFLARNEIYARHGRRFQSAELQQYFGSKEWYSGIIAPGDFNDDMLTQVERDNANLMLAIEKERNSPYLD